MGKVIHTKDGRTLMKGPDGRWMSAGKAAEKSSSYDSSKSKTYKTKGVAGAKKSAEEMLGTSLTVHEKRRSAIDTTYELRDKNNEVVGTILQGNTSRDSKMTLYNKKAAKEAVKAEKKPITNETREGWNAILNSKDGDKIRIQDFSSLNHKPTGTETEYTLHNGRWSSVGGHSFNNDITNKGFGSFEGTVPKITKVESEAPKKAVKETTKTEKKIKSTAIDGLQPQTDYFGKGAKSLDDLDGPGKLTHIDNVLSNAKSHQTITFGDHSYKKINDHTFANQNGVQYSKAQVVSEVKAYSDQRSKPAKKTEKKPFRRGHAINQKTPRTVKKTEEGKSLSFEKREGYGLNPSEYKLSNGDGISPKSLNPNEGNPTNIKQLKDIPGRTSRHTDEIIVKSNYGDKEYVVTREHYQDTKTGYHKAEVVDIRQHTPSEKTRSDFKTEDGYQTYLKKRSVFGENYDYDSLADVHRRSANNKTQKIEDWHGRRSGETEDQWKAREAEKKASVEKQFDSRISPIDPQAHEQIAGLGKRTNTQAKFKNADGHEIEVYVNKLSNRDYWGKAVGGHTYTVNVYDKTDDKKLWYDYGVDDLKRVKDDVYRVTGISKPGKSSKSKSLVPKNQIEVSDSHYIYSSGRKPSGNGNWAFYIGDSEEPIFFNGKYSEAKKKAIAEAAKRGVKKITLGS